MMMYENIFPDILVIALEALCSRERLLIISYLVVHGRATSREIAKALGMNVEDAKKHLQKLEAGNIVRSIITEHGIEYELTSFASELVYHILSTLEPAK